jgi:hypothetical protein
MSRAAVDAIARAVLYEGYVLYPYRPSSIKNRQRWSFGVLFPPSWRCGADASALRAECLVRGAAPAVDVALRFLHAADRDGWHDAVERTVAAPRLTLDGDGARHETPFAFAAERGERGTLERVEGTLTVATERLDDTLWRVRVDVANRSPWTGDARDQALLHSLVSAHVVLRAADGAFVSLLDPPPALAAAAAACCNTGVWPVLVGDPARADTLLASPVVLYDYPRIAPESPGELCDATEIDEILSLRILTLTDDEKREARAADPRARAILDRTEALSPAELERLHGAMRDPLRPGARVRLRPKRRADAFDLMLAGRAATVATVERDFEDRVYVTVTIDDDPGRDLGLTGQPGHRFFYFADEVEPLS